MKYIKICLLMIFTITLIPCVPSAETKIKDPELTKVLETMVSTFEHSPNRKFPQLPIEADFKSLETRLFNYDYKLPMPLKEYHLVCGNKLFSEGISFPTVHQREDGSCNLYNFIRKGHDKGIPFTKEGQATGTPQENWLPFAEDGSDYICMELGTGKVCNFYFDYRLRKDDTEFPNLSSWLKDRLSLK